QWMCGHSRSGSFSIWGAIELGGVDAGDLVSHCFIDRMREFGAFVDCQPGPNCWRVELPATWNDYLALLSKSHRKQVRRLERRWFASGRAVLHSVVQPADLDRGLDILADLHVRRRGNFGEAGVFADERFAAFHREVAEQLLADDALRLSWIEFDGRPVAAEYQVAGKHVVYAYQSGIDPAALDLEPGRLAMMATLRRAIENRYRSFDLLRGDEPYKAHWRARPRASMEVRIFAAQGADWFKHRARVAGVQLRRWLHANWQRATSLAHVN
ncbi:MAG: GNAT family N-acetyltransferase, partial [Pirellulales bacterium]